jgi:hypothetical protein
MADVQSLVAGMIRPLKCKVALVDNDGNPVMWEFPEIGHLPMAISRNEDGSFYEVCVGEGGKTLTEAKKWANTRFRSWMVGEFLDMDALAKMLAEARADGFSDGYAKGVADEPKGYVIWADGPPPDGAEGEWVVWAGDMPFHVRWGVGSWHVANAPGWQIVKSMITRHARLD